MTDLFLIRVDDFPAWTEEMNRFVPSADFMAFHRVLASHGIPYMLASTPQPALCPLEMNRTETRSLSDEECSIIRTIAAEGATIGLHGITHHTRAPRPHSEFLDIDDGFFAELVAYGDHELHRLTGIRAEVFVAPFNRMSKSQLAVLATRFPVVCGGPETVPSVGKLDAFAISPASVYLPSYPPHYGRAHEILANLKSGPSAFPTCLTLHWEWERRRGYQELDELCKALKGRVAAWNTLTKR